MISFESSTKGRFMITYVNISIPLYTASLEKDWVDFQQTWRLSGVAWLQYSSCVVHEIPLLVGEVAEWLLKDGSSLPAKHGSASDGPRGPPGMRAQLSVRRHHCQKKGTVASKASLGRSCKGSAWNFRHPLAISSVASHWSNPTLCDLVGCRRAGGGIWFLQWRIMVLLST